MIILTFFNKYTWQIAFQIECNNWQEAAAYEYEYADSHYHIEMREE